jgi:hypothetical protein
MRKLRTEQQRQLTRSAYGVFDHVTGAAGSRRNSGMRASRSVSAILITMRARLEPTQRWMPRQKAQARTARAPAQSSARDLGSARGRPALSGPSLLSFQLTFPDELWNRVDPSRRRGSRKPIQAARPRSPRKCQPVHLTRNVGSLALPAERFVTSYAERPEGYKPSGREEAYTI